MRSLDERSVGLVAGLLLDIYDKSRKKVFKIKISDINRQKRRIDWDYSPEIIDSALAKLVAYKDIAKYHSCDLDDLYVNGFNDSGENMVIFTVTLKSSSIAKLKFRAENNRSTTPDLNEQSEATQDIRSTNVRIGKKCPFHIRFFLHAVVFPGGFLPIGYRKHGKEKERSPW